MKNLLKLTTFIFTFSVMMAFSSTTTSAAEITPEIPSVIDTGYTDDGIYYEIIETPKLVKNEGWVSPQSVIEIYVERTVVYYAVMEPFDFPTSIQWAEQFDQYTTIRGTLYLNFYTINYDTKITTCVYVGYLTGRV